MRLFWLSAEMMPSGMATRAVTTMVATPNWNDTGAAAEIADQTGLSLISELPQLP